MTEHDTNDKTRRSHAAHDEADNIRRASPGDRMSARDGGANAKASVEGSFWLALVALMGVIAVAILVGFVLGGASERDESVDQRLAVLGSRISVLEYDAARMCAQLLEADLVEACH